MGNEIGNPKQTPREGNGLFSAVPNATQLLPSFQAVNREGGLFLPQDICSFYN